MRSTCDRRSFLKTVSSIGGISLLPIGWAGCDSELKGYGYTPKKYDIFAKYKTPKKLVRFDTLNLAQEFPDADRKQMWILRSVITIFQGLINRIEPRIYLKHGANDVDWLGIYKSEGHDFEVEQVKSIQDLISMFAGSLAGYVVFDPDMLDSLNIAQTWASLENWLVIAPEMESMLQKTGLQKKQDLRGRWQGRVPAYQWAFKNLFPRCSKHVVGDCCIDFPHHPSDGSYHIRDFLVANNAFTFDLSAALRQRQEYRLLDKIYASLEFPAGVWGWHDSRDHEHWAVDRAARKGVYTICAVGGPNLTVHGGVKPQSEAIPKQKPSPRKNLVAEEDKIYLAFMMTDGDALWVMDTLQLHNWASEKRGDFPLSWGFLPLLADIAPAMYSYYVKKMLPNDYMVAGPSGAGYTYPHMYPDPKQFLKYTKFYMQKCGLEIVNITNWNDYTHWQEVDLPWFNPLLFSELDNCLGYVRGMGESAFEPHYNLADKPFIFCGEGIHRGDRDDVATIKNFIDANPNRPLFVFCLINVAVSMERIKKVVDSLQHYHIEYVRLDDFMRLIKSARMQNLITEELYPNRKGNGQILANEAPASWEGTKKNIEVLVPILQAVDEAQALALMNAEEAGLALGQRITEEDKADILAFALCTSMFSLVKNVLNYQGIYVNLRQESVDKFMELHGAWKGAGSVAKLFSLWKNWEQMTFSWQEVVEIGCGFLKVSRQADKLICG